MDSKRILVTGGTKGLGLAISQILLSSGYHVIATGRTLSLELSDLMQQSAGSQRGHIVFESLDLSETTAIHRTISGIIKRHGALYGLVNNAALAHDGILATMHDSQIEEVITVNVTGTILLTKYALRTMLLGEVGRVVNIASIIANTGFNGLSVYGASKAALLGFTYSLARELGKANITVNAILPGYMKTAMTAGLDDKQLTSIIRRSPMGKLVDVQDVAHAVAFFLSPEAATITGTTLTIDAGSTC